MLREILENLDLKKFDKEITNLLNDIVEEIANKNDMNRNSILNVLSKPYSRSSEKFLEEIDFDSVAEEYIDKYVIDKFFKKFGDEVVDLAQEYLEKYADEKTWVEPLINVLLDKIEVYG